MAKHIKTGRKGEELAREYLAARDYHILELNWRYRHWEVDIIASKNNILHFIEIKTRQSNKYGFPEETVNVKKIKNLIGAAEIYLYRHPEWQRIQFDILSITLTPETAYFLIEDVYL
jgi:putative endonuclease